MRLGHGVFSKFLWRIVAHPGSISQCLTGGGCYIIPDIPDKTQALVENLEANLPITARTTPRLVIALRQQNPDLTVPQTCQVVSIHYAGDEGGIVCQLDFGALESKSVPFVSITHLAFDRNAPLAREIDAYQRHRVKKLRQQQGR
jgi:hypothetical protein